MMPRLVTLVGKRFHIRGRLQPFIFLAPHICHLVQDTSKFIGSSKGASGSSDNLSSFSPVYRCVACHYRDEELGALNLVG
jgi:hypothetical protein